MSVRGALGCLGDPGRGSAGTRTKTGDRDRDRGLGLPGRDSAYLLSGSVDDPGREASSSCGCISAGDSGWG